MDFGERFYLNCKFYRTYPVVVESNSDNSAWQDTSQRLSPGLFSHHCFVDPPSSHVSRSGNKHGSFFFFPTWKLFLKDWIEAALIHFHKTLFHFLATETEVFWDTEGPDRDHWGASSYPVLEAGWPTPNGVQKAADGIPVQQCHLRALCRMNGQLWPRRSPRTEWLPRAPTPPSPAGVLTLRWSTASMRGSPSHRLGFLCFLCCFVGLFLISV